MPPPHEMPSRRVLFTGQTGIGYKKAIETIALMIAKEYGLPETLDSTKTLDFIYVANLEEKFKDKGAADINLLLDSYDPKVLREIATDVFASMLEEIEAKKPRVVLFSLHSTMFRNGIFHSTQVLNLVKQYCPDLIVTFIDDAYIMWKRVVDRNAQNPTRSYLRLKDIMMWRSVEILTSDLLAKLVLENTKNQDIEQRNIVLAAKHSPQMLYRLIMEPWRLNVYASFPISRTRDDPTRRKEVDAFREELFKRYIVFDPLTIDEKILEFALKKQPKEKNEVILDGSERWPIDPNNSLVSELAANYPINLNQDEVREIATEKPPDNESDIGKQIQWRDFRLIRQCNVLAAYRPFGWEKKGARGVLGEINHAAAVAKRWAIVYHPKEDETDAKSPFDTRVIRCTSLGEMFATMDKWADKKKAEYGVTK